MLHFNYYLSFIISKSKGILVRKDQGQQKSFRINKKFNSFKIGRKLLLQELSSIQTIFMNFFKIKSRRKPDATTNNTY